VDEHLRPFHFDVDVNRGLVCVLSYRDECSARNATSCKEVDELLRCRKLDRASGSKCFSDGG
jgi:hypothetical protein